MQAYSNPKRADDPHALPDVEVFYAPHAEMCDVCGTTALDGFGDQACDCPTVYANTMDESQREHVPGWYWCPCFPGCLPDGDPNGPFATEAEALADAQDGAE
jgi:hypothetical protein